MVLDGEKGKFISKHRLEEKYMDLSDLMEGARVLCLTGELELHLLQLRPSSPRKKKSGKVIGSVDQRSCIYKRDKARKVVDGCQRGSSVKLRP